MFQNIYYYFLEKRKNNEFLQTQYFPSNSISYSRNKLLLPLQ